MIFAVIVIIIKPFSDHLSPIVWFHDRMKMTT